MRSVNKVILIGNLTRDPELKNTPNGQPIVTFGIATNREWVTSEKEKKSLAEFHNIVAWGKLAEICNQFLKKGKLVYIEGYLKTRSWDNENGTKSFRTEIVANDMIILDRDRKDARADAIINEAEAAAMEADTTQSPPTEEDNMLDNLI
jgi:single-strand DNA-binding protein